MNDNPYAPPSAPPGLPSEPTARRALRWVLTPAVVLLLMAGLSLVENSWVIGIDTFRFVTSGPAAGSGMTVETLAALAFFVTIVGSQLLIVIGAWKMLRLRSRRWALTAGWLSVIPVLSPFYLLGIPIGIWALIVLYRGDVKAAFRQAADERELLRRAANH